MKRSLKIIHIVAVAVIGLMVALPGCDSESDSTQGSQVANVQRGDLTIDITAVGNLELAKTEDLAFEIAGTVVEVLVEEGDSVEEGQELAKLDTSEWNDQLRALEKKLVDAERYLITRERSMTTAERQVTAKELAVRQAELDLQTAENALYDMAEVKSYKDAVDALEFDLRIAQEMKDWQMLLYLQERLAQAREELQDVLSGNINTTSSDVLLQFEKSKLQVEQKQRLLEDAQLAVEDAILAVDDAQFARDDAEQEVKDAQSALDEAKSKSPVITAPFAGFITRVNVEGGDEVVKGTVAVQLADPDKFEADILVSEMDIFQVQLEGEARVQVDAMSGISLPAKVTHISPTATIQSGVVNYIVKVELESLEAVLREQQQVMEERRQAMQETRQGMEEDIASGQIPERLQQAIDEGLMTKEQVEEMMERMKQMQEEGGMPFPPIGGEGETSLPAGGGQTTIISLENFQLREGLTVTVSLIVSESTNVLLVPNSAITYQGRQAYVEVVTPDGVTEQRAIQTGLTDYQNTEVTDGLAEGEQVVVPEGTTTTTTTTTQPSQKGTIMIPGLGGPRR